MKAEDLRYSKDHLWVAVDGDVASVGMSDHAQREMGDVVFLDLPEVGRKLAQGEVVGSVESVKTTSDLFTPLSGEVVEANTAVRDAPNTENTDPLGKGWLFRIRLSRPDELKQLLDLEAYTKLVHS